MSDFGDYLDEMERNRITDVEIEALLSGSLEVRDDLQGIAGFFAALATDVDSELDENAIGRLVAKATAVAGATPSDAKAPRAPWRISLAALRRRVATITIGATVVLSGTGGLALAADSSKPGDTLYGVDRAFEAVGIGAGSVDERLDEAEALIAANEFSRGLDHATEAIESHGDSSPAATAALVEAAQRVRASDGNLASSTKESVAGLLAYLSDNTGNVDGQVVAELASQIGAGADRPGVGNSDESPSQSPPEPPGLSDDTPGRSEGPPANPSDQDKPEPGPPDHVPTDPPGKDKAEPGPPDHVPADPPGQDKKPSKPPKAKP